jgi:hypothetical protein
MSKLIDVDPVAWQPKHFEIADVNRIEDAPMLPACTIRSLSNADRL